MENYKLDLNAEKYLSKYAEVRQNAFINAFEGDYFDGLTSVEIDFFKTYKMTQPYINEINKIESNVIFENLFSKYPCLDTNWLIDNYGDIYLDDDFHIGYFLYWYGIDGCYQEYVQNGNDDKNNVAKILYKIQYNFE